MLPFPPPFLHLSLSLSLSLIFINKQTHARLLSLSLSLSESQPLQLSFQLPFALNTAHVEFFQLPSFLSLCLPRYHLPIFLKYGPNPASFCLFFFFSQCKGKYYTNLTFNDLSVDGVLGLEPGAAGWKSQMNPLSYGGTPVIYLS